MIHLTLHQLSAYLDGELADASTELVRLHLSQCAECTDRFARMEAQEEILVRLLNHDPGDSFFEFFRSAITLDGRDAPPRWPSPEPPVAKPGASAGLDGDLAGPEPDVGIPLGEIEASFEGDPEALIPNVDRAGPRVASAPQGPQGPPAREAPRTPAAPPPVLSPLLYGRREDDRVRAPRRGGSAGWIVAGVMAVVALSVAFVTTRPRVSPRPIPATEDATSGGETTRAQAAAGDEARVATGSDLEASTHVPAGTIDPDSSLRTAAAEDADAPSSLELLELPVWARAKEIAPPPPPRATERATGSATMRTTTPKPAAPSTPAPRAAVPVSPESEPAAERLVDRPPRHVVPVRTIITRTVDSDAGPGTEPPAPDTASKAPAAEDVASIEREFEGAKRRSLLAAGTMTADAFEAAAAAWEMLQPRLAGEPEREAIAWREAAQARFQAWAVGPTALRREAAVRTVRAYLLYAPPGPDRDQAWTWLGRLKQSTGAPAR